MINLRQAVQQGGQGYRGLSFNSDESETSVYYKNNPGTTPGVVPTRRMIRYCSQLMRRHFIFMPVTAGGRHSGSLVVTLRGWGHIFTLGVGDGARGPEVIAVQIRHSRGSILGELHDSRPACMLINDLIRD